VLSHDIFQLGAILTVSEGHHRFGETFRTPVVEFVPKAYSPVGVA
jgi:hypothetical protein